MADFNRNIISLSDMTPENIAKNLLEITNSFNAEKFSVETNTDYFNNKLSLDSICAGIKETLEI